MFILNYFYFIIITLFSAKFLFGEKVAVSYPYNQQYKLLLTGPEMFWLLTFSTGLFAFSAPAGLDLMALRLLVLEFFYLIGLFIIKTKPIWGAPVVIYIFYITWLVVGLLNTPSPDYGIRVIMKYIYPLFIMVFSSAIMRHSEFFLKVSQTARIVALVSLITLILPLGSVIPGVLWYPTARAIHYITISMFSLAMFFYGGKKQMDLWMAIAFMLPCIVWVFRTSIMGTALALAVFFFFKYKLKSVPFLFLVLAMFVASIFLIPSVKEKMFFETDGKSVESLQNGDISFDDINSNGRFAMWEWSLENFYDKNEFIGSGTGNLQEIFYKLKHPFGGIRICHNDYVQILCDNGLIGLFLFGSSFIFLIIHCFIVFQKKSYPWSIRVCAITAGSSMAGVLLTLYTDNVINYSMCTISYPCGFYGMMLGLIRGYKQLSTNAVQ